MNMTIGKKERDLLIGLAGVFVAVLVWFLIASPTLEKKDALHAENETLRPKAEEYQAVAARLTEYEEGLVAYETERDDILSHYPSSMRKEDLLMFWSNIDLMNVDNLLAGDIELDEWEAVEIEGAEAAPEEVTYDEEGNVVESTTPTTEVDSNYVLYKAPIAYEFACTYEGAKDSLRYLYEQYEKNQITGYSLEYDDATGLLYGNAYVNLFYIDGTEKEYTPAFIPTLPSGVDNIFHTIDGTVAERKAAGAPDADARDGGTDTSDDDDTEDSDETTDSNKTTDTKKSN